MSPDFTSLPSALIESAEKQWQDYLAACERHSVTPVTLPSLLNDISVVWAASPFCSRACWQRPQLLEQLIGSSLIEKSYVCGELTDRMTTELDGCSDEEDLKCRLRRFRNREMVRITWRDITNVAALEETTRDLSDLADAALQHSLDWLQKNMCETFGTPFDGDGEPARFFVIGMGKLGAYELNFSSDIDLIFVYTCQGETSGGRRSLSNSEYFNRLGKRLIACINDITPDGFVFRVDMRLRPFGESGPLVVSEDAMMSYYEAHARDWERYALIKARICAGDVQAGKPLFKALRPFVYRRYIDFSVMSSLRNMKGMINRQVIQKGMLEDVKLGPGGIREIEFIGQVFQLVRGGKEPCLQNRRIQDVLISLAELNLLSADASRELGEAYRFLRTTEHRLQQLNDQQTQQLPDNEIDCSRIALGMGFENWPSFYAALEQHRQHVKNHFDQLLQEPEESGQNSPQHVIMTAVWEDPENASPAHLSDVGYQHSESVLSQLVKLKTSHSVRHMGAEGQQRLQQLMPVLLEQTAQQSDPDVTLARILKLIETIARRSVYLTLLIENPQALENLLRLMSVSVFVAEQLVRQPMLMDELLDPRTLYTPPDTNGLKQDLDNRLRKCPRGDLEQYMEVLRQFKNAQVLHVAAADIAGNLPVPDVSNYLSAIAETITDMALTLAWLTMTDRYGEPWCEDNGEYRPAGFCIVAYGKLGGLELGYSSDLDIIFLHDSRGSRQMTNGDKPLENAVFFTRLTQRIIHLLSTNTPAGMAYEVDTRLRPNGASGMMVSSLDAFATYQKDKAWTWEHQALVRARTVTGSDQTRLAFDDIRADILRQQRDRNSLKRDIIDMREKMRDNLNRSTDDIFDLKQGRGGITDLEFMVQYAVLRWSTEHSRLLDYTDNLRSLETLTACNIISNDDCEQLKQAYFALRGEVHHLALQGKKGLVAETNFTEFRDVISRHWDDFITFD